MSKAKIDEMARSLCLLKKDNCEDCTMNEHCLMRNCAECFYNAGYRKASEIFEDILKIKGLELHDWEAFAELKEKYIQSEDTE